MTRPGSEAGAPGKGRSDLPLPVLLADRQGVAFVATALGVESLRVPRRYWGMEIGLVPIPASDEEIRASDAAPPSDAGTWPSVVPRPDLLAPALSRLLSREHIELSVQPSHDGLRATLLTPHGEEQPFPIAPKDALGFLAAVLHYSPCGVAATGAGKPSRVLLSVRPANRRLEYRLKLAGVVTSPPPATLTETGLSPALVELILEGLERTSGIFLVSGGPSTGRSTMLALLASTLAARGHKGGFIGARRLGAKPDLLWLAEALSDWPFPESLHASAPDFVLVDRLAGTGDLILAARLAASGSLVLAGAPAADPEALARTVVRDLEAGSGPQVPVAILAQSLVRTVCRQCVTWRTIPPSQAARLGLQHRDLEEVERKGGLAVPSGKGCADCAGTGCANLTGVFEYVAPEAGTGSLPRMREDGWRKVAQGVACPEDVSALPGAQRTMRSLREILVHAGLNPVAVESQTDPASARSTEIAKETHDRRGRRGRSGGPSAHESASVAALVADLERLLREAAAGRPIAPESLHGLIRSIVSRGESEEPLSPMLAKGKGFQLTRHSVNTALIAARIACRLGVDIDPAQVAALALLHDIGLLAAGVDPGAELPAVPLEEALDPAGVRLAPASVAPAREAAGGGDLIQQVQVLLSSGAPGPVDAAHADTRAQAVALASLVELCFRGPGSERVTDLHDVTSIVMERYGRRFGAALFRGLLRAIPIFPIGALVELSSGDLARVVSLNEDNQFRPRVEIAATGGGESLSERRVVDLSRAPFLHIRHRVAGIAPDGVGSAVAAGRRS